MPIHADGSGENRRPSAVKNLSEISKRFPLFGRFYQEPESTILQKRLTSSICSMLEHRARARAGAATTIARLWAREMATLSRFLLQRNSIPRGEASQVLEAIEISTTGASCP